MNRRSPPWGAIEAFVVAARVGSFKSAAAELELSPSAFSRRLQQLEAHVGARLFDRTEAIPSLTPAGRRYLARLEPGYAMIRSATEWMVPGEGKRPLRIGVSQSFAISWLLPRLAGFRELHPSIEVTLHTRTGTVDLPGGSADIGIVHGDGHWPGIRTRKLMQMQGAIVCSPGVLVQAGAGEAPALTPGLPLLETLSPPDVWQFWRDQTGDPLSESGDRLYFDSVQVMYEAAVLGLGLAIGIRPLVDPFLASGRLVAPFDRRVTLPGGYHVAALPAMLREPPVRAFWKWLIDQAESEPAAPSCLPDPMSDPASNPDREGAAAASS